jgi:hypothetical protein
MAEEQQERRGAWERDDTYFDNHGNAHTIGKTSWSPVDLGPVLRGEKRALEPSHLKRSDGQALLYPGSPHVFFGESESLKSWAAFIACRSFLDAGFTALYIDFESNDVSFVERARIVGIPDGAIGNTFKYVRPEEPLVITDRYTGEVKDSTDASFDLLALRETLAPGIIVVDGVSEAYALHGWEINKAEHATHFQRVFGGWGDATASIAIDHAGKDAERGQIGSQHKRAGLDGAQFEFSSVKREGRGGHSIAAIKVTKDRHGSVRAFAPDGYIGTIHVSDEVWIEAPKADDDPGVKEQMAVVTWIVDNPGQSGNAIAEALKKRKGTIQRMLKDLQIDGYLRAEAGPNRSTLWYAVQPSGGGESTEDDAPTT